MSLNKFTNTDIKDYIKIGASEIACSDLTVNGVPITGGGSFDQDLNTFDDVAFESVATSGVFSQAPTNAEVMTISSTKAQVDFPIELGCSGTFVLTRKNALPVGGTGRGTIYLDDDDNSFKAKTSDSLEQLFVSQDQQVNQTSDVTFNSVNGFTPAGGVYSQILPSPVVNADALAVSIIDPTGSPGRLTLNPSDYVSGSAYRINLGGQINIPVTLLDKTLRITVNVGFVTIYDTDFAVLFDTDGVSLPYSHVIDFTFIDGRVHSHGSFKYNTTPNDQNPPGDFVEFVSGELSSFVDNQPVDIDIVYQWGSALANTSIANEMIVISKTF